MLKRFNDPINAIVFGAGGGIGAAFVDLLAQSAAVRKIHGITSQKLVSAHDKLVYHRVDILNDADLARSAADLADCEPRLIIYAAGMLHDDHLQPEKTWRHLTPEAMQKIFAVNTIAPAMIIKHFLPIMPRKNKAVFAALSARVGSISDNKVGGWYSYRASKAALNMVLRTASIELARRWPDAACIGLHPGTVDTALSDPFQGNVPSQQLFTPAQSAQKMLSVIDGVDASDTGQTLDYAGKVIAS